MGVLNPVVEGMPRSGIRAILDEANKYDDVLHLEIGQPDLPTPLHIVEAGVRAAREGYTTYTPNAGFPSLREAFATRLSQELALNVRADQVVVTVGAMGALFSALCATVSEGDEVLVPDPGYPNYRMGIRLLGAQAVPYPLEATSGFVPRLEAISSLITERSRAIIVNSPSNPTGAVVDAETVQGLVDLAQRHGLYIISDEAYDHVVFRGKHVSCLQYDDGSCVIGVYSCSKTYSMTGWRVGFAVSAPKIAAVLTKLQEVYVSCASSVSQKAAEAALTGPQQCVDEMLSTYRRRRDLAVTLCGELGLKCVMPHGAFYLMIASPEAARLGSMEYALRLVREARLAVAPGSTFGARGEGFVRVSLCANEATISGGLQRLASYEHRQ